MILCIAGPGNVQVCAQTIRHIIEQLFDEYKPVTEVIHGYCTGVDGCASKYAEYYHIPCTEFPVLWEQDGNKAVHLRNRRMAISADVLLVIHDGSPGQGTRSVVAEFMKQCKEIHVVVVRRATNVLDT
jgi:hypothetical protein